MRFKFIKIVLIALVANFSLNVEASPWPIYDDFMQKHYHEGKIVNTDGNIYASEQIYAMFFALVQKDQKRFDKLYSYLKQNFVKGSFEKNLVPIAFDGQKVVKDGIYTDYNLFLAYTLINANAIFDGEQYLNDALLILKNIKSNFAFNNQHFGNILLPYWQNLKEHSFTLNSNTYAPFVLAKIASIDPEFKELYLNSMQALIKASGLGFVPDELKFNHQGDFLVYKNTYAKDKALNFYLWLSISPKADPNYRLLKLVFENLTDDANAYEKLDDLVNFYDKSINQSNKMLTKISLLNLCEHKIKDHLRAFIKAYHFSSEQSLEHLAAMFALGIDELRFDFSENGSVLIGK